MALTKVNASLYSAFSMSPSAGGTPSAWVDVQDSYETQVNIKITNGTTIAAAAMVRVEVSSQSGGVNAAITPDYAASTVNGAVTSWSVTLPMGVEFFRVVPTHPTYSGSVSVLDVEYTKVTSI